MVLLIDNYDSFTYNLYDYILQLGETCRVIRNDELTIEQIADIPFHSAVISPGPKTPAEAGITKAFIAEYYQSKPILGICLGHQALGEFFGGKLVRAAQPMHGKTTVIKHNHSTLFKSLPEQLEVMRYHSLLLQDVEGTEMNVTATTTDGEIMAIAHKTLPLAGVQFHPESILTPQGLTIMRNWFSAIASAAR
ncbi:MAG: aminodeoxychorismate/anthranilate synthase component II [Chitinophagales bacterium]